MNLVYRSPQNPNSHLSAKERTQESFPVRYLLQTGLIRGRGLDFGCGLGADVNFLRNKGFDVTGIDPYYAPDLPQGKFDTILCLYVLNILLPIEQAQVLMAVSELLRSSGRAYFSVRRDISRDGLRTHLKHWMQVYQCNVKLPYASILRTENDEIYKYRHYNQIPHPNSSDCPFCVPEAERDLLTESATCYAIFDKYPVSTGHALIIPKKHVPNYFDLLPHTKTVIWLMADRVKDLLLERFQPDGLNVGINVGEAAGQPVPHAYPSHPALCGRCRKPERGMRAVIPVRKDYFELK